MTEAFLLVMDTSWSLHQLFADALSGGYDDRLV